MKPGHGEILLAEGDPRVREDEERLVEEFRRQLDEGMWAAVPETALAGGVPRVRGDGGRLVGEFRRQPDGGMWAAVPETAPDAARRQARMVRSYRDIPAEAERVIFFPRAAGG